MPKPPTLIAPLPNETIASATWGDPVTDAINGLTTGESLVGAIVWTETGGQNLSSTFTPITFQSDYVQYDSDAFCDLPNNRFVVPPGLEGLYRVNIAISLTTHTDGSAARMSVRRNGASFFQHQAPTAYNSQLSMSFAGILRLGAGDSLQIYGQSGTSAPVAFKAFSLLRIANIFSAPQADGGAGYDDLRDAAGKPA